MRNSRIFCTNARLSVRIKCGARTSPTRRVVGHRAFMIGIVDWFSRKVLAYNVVNTMDAFHCVETLKTAMDFYGKPEIFNSDQGSQFTSSEFVVELRAHGIQISMDGRGRRLDNAKMERF